MKAYVHVKTCTWKFIKDLFNRQNQNNPISMSINRWMRIYIYMVLYLYHVILFNIKFTIEIFNKIDGYQMCRMKESRQNCTHRMILFILAFIMWKWICHYKQTVKRAGKKVYEEWYSGSHRFNPEVAHVTCAHISLPKQLIWPHLTLRSRNM